ncbi:hypothetical protein P9112_013303 [Eukaryota sp. TZLM1-RC]
MYSSSASYQAVPAMDGYVMQKPVRYPYDERKNNNSCCACCCCATTSCLCCCVCSLICFVALVVCGALVIWNVAGNACNGDLQEFDHEQVYDFSSDLTISAYLSRAKVTFGRSLDGKIHVNIHERTSEDEAGATIVNDGEKLSISHPQSFWNFFKCYELDITILLPDQRIHKIDLGIASPINKKEKAVIFDTSLSVRKLHVASGTCGISSKKISFEKIEIISGTGHYYFDSLVGDSHDSSAEIGTGTGSITVGSIFQGQYDLGAGTGKVDATLAENYQGTFNIKSGNKNVEVTGERATITKNGSQHKKGYVDSEEGSALKAESGSAKVVLNVL